MKKHILSISVIIVLSILLCSCSQVQDNVSNQQLSEYLVKNSITLTSTMDSLAQSTEYINMTSGSPDLIEIVTSIGAEDFTAPNKAVLIKIPDTTIDSIIKDMAGELNLQGDAYEMVVTRLCASVPSIINAQQGVNTIAVTSILNVSKAFQKHRDFTDNTYVILIYDNYNSVTFYRNSVEGITSSSSSFLFLTDDMKKALTDETASDYLSQEFNINGIEVEYIDGDAIANYK